MSIKLPYQELRFTFLNNKSVYRKTGHVLLSETTASKCRFPPLSNRRNHKVTKRGFNLELRTISRTLNSQSTAAQRLKEGTLHARKPIVCDPPTPSSKGAHLNF